MRRNVLIIAGTAEARALASALVNQSDWRVISSLAGRTTAPRMPEGEVRVGGFGGATPLANYLRAEAIAAVVDASHPFAVGISRHALAATQTAGVPLLRLNRPPWTAQQGDRWHEVGDWPEALPLLPKAGGRIFLATGKQELRAFAGLEQCFFLARTVDPPDTPLPLHRYEVEVGRGPFAVEDEIALLQRHAITHVVCKNSGGTSAYGKIEAARWLELPVIIKRRPPKLQTPEVSTVADALTWLEAIAA